MADKIQLEEIPKVDENQLDEYIKRLQIAKSPNRLLGGVYTLLFNKELTKQDWARLGQMINRYGRQKILMSFLKASGNENLDLNKSIWGYINAICISLVEDEQAEKELISQRLRASEETKQLLIELSKEPVNLELKDKEWLISNNA